MMSDEEVKAIKYFYNLRATIDESYMLFDEGINVKCGKEMMKQISIILNLCSRLEEENRRKDKMINLMAEEIINYEVLDDLDFNNSAETFNRLLKDKKEFFKNKVKESK